jgi:hypothetical protein
VKVVNLKTEDADIYVGRPSKWGNPYSHIPGKGRIYVATRELAISLYEQLLLGNAELMAALPELRGKVLGCWCKPLACHGDFLLAHANKVVDTEAPGQ